MSKFVRFLSTRGFSPLYAGYTTTLYSEQFAAGVAAGLCVVSMGIVLLTVPETTKDTTRLAGTSDSYSEPASTVSLPVQ